MRTLCAAVALLGCLACASAPADCTQLQCPTGQSCGFQVATPTCFLTCGTDGGCANGSACMCFAGCPTCRNCQMGCPP